MMTSDSFGPDASGLPDPRTGTFFDGPAEDDVEMFNDYAQLAARDRAIPALQEYLLELRECGLAAGI